LRNERGFALVITLLITALLVALCAEFVDEVFVDTSARQNFTDGQQASLLADSGMTGGIRLLEFGLSTRNYSSLADLDSLNKLLRIADEKGTIQVTVEEESGKLNINAIVSPNGELNRAYYDIAVRLFDKLKIENGKDLLDAVADWIDKNDEPKPGGAETNYYQTLKPPYAAKNNYLETYEELRLVKGFDRKTMERLRPYLTVYPDVPGTLTAGLSTPININTAAKELIASLDDNMTDDLAQRIIDYRKTTPLKSATDLGNSVPGMGTLSSDLAKAPARIMQQPEKGTVFRLTSRAQVNETVRVIEAVVRVGGQQPLYWREY
jgi:general secretion pathway protein K